MMKAAIGGVINSKSSENRRITIPEEHRNDNVISQLASGCKCGCDGEVGEGTTGSDESADVESGKIMQNTKWRSTMSKQWFDVDKAGLGKQAEELGKGRLIGELVQNALDEKGVTRIDGPCKKSCVS